MIHSNELLAEYKRLTHELGPLEQRLKAIRKARAAIKRTLHKRGVVVAKDAAVLASPLSSLVSDKMIAVMEDDPRHAGQGFKYENELELLIKRARGDI